MGAAPSVCKALAQAADEGGTYYARVRRLSGPGAPCNTRYS